MLQLVIGNKNYSSWSMRPWVLMKGLGLPFDEIRLSFNAGTGDAYAAVVRPYSPAGRVPVLIDDGYAVWDSLAITEYLHEKFPAAGVWPDERKLRARARSVCAEMHAGFSALRSACPMNVEAALPEAGARVWAEQPALRQDVARIESIWAAALAASGGPFLFGAFGAADAYYAPVASRLRTYALPVSEATRRYGDRLLAAPGPASWIADALAEHEFVVDEEPYRTRP
jgi:glutathione S-transferase